MRELYDQSMRLLRQGHLASGLHFQYHKVHSHARQIRHLLTLAIETSCDDTSVAILSTSSSARTTLHFHQKITSNNIQYGGVHPIEALESHQKNLATLIHKSFPHLPLQDPKTATLKNALLVPNGVGDVSSDEIRQKPDFITVTRGPGMRSSLSTGIDAAKGLAVAWQVPLLGVNHMQAHALTPRLVSALHNDKGSSDDVSPAFPFLTLLLSGGHTMLVHSRSLTNHAILVQTSDMALGDVLDKVARDILPPHVLESSESVMYGAVLEKFAFPNGTRDYAYSPLTNNKDFLRTKPTGYSWSFNPPFSVADGGAKANRMQFTFSGIGSKVKSIMALNPDMSDDERRVLARETMRVAFEHVISRLLLTLASSSSQQSTPTIQPSLLSTIVISGGVASNQYLKYILSSTLLAREELKHVQVNTPPIELCTDNAAMIAWTGIEMWKAGWRSSLEIGPLRKWSVDEEAGGGGILGVEGWIREESGV